MLKFIQKHKFTIIGMALGATAGFFYWQQIGCASGTCAITSNPVNSTLYGTFMGALLGSMFTKEPAQEQK